MTGKRFSKTYQNIKYRFRKTIKSAVSFESYSKVASQSYELEHVSTEVIREYSDHQFVKLFRMKCIVCYLPVEVSKAPSCT